MSVPADRWPAPIAPLSGEEDAAWERRPSRASLLADRLRSNRQFQVGAGLLGAFLAVALLALARWGGGVADLPTNFDWAVTLDPPGPSAAHPFGVINGVGIDLFQATVRAVPIDLALLGGTILIAITIGVFLGAWAGFRGGPVDLAVTAASDLVIGVPPFFLVIVLFLGVQPFIQPPSYLYAFGGLFALILWPYYARTVRARAQQVAGEPYVESARAAGATNTHLLFRHLIPNSFFPVLSQVPVDLYNFLFVLTLFPFIGCFDSGFFATLSPLPTAVYPEWGWLLATGACYGWNPLPSLDHWWMYTFPAITIVTFGIAVTLTCDGIERYLTGARAST